MRSNVASSAAAAASAKASSGQPKPKPKPKPTLGRRRDLGGGASHPGELPTLMELCEMDQAQLRQECTKRGIRPAASEAKGALIVRLRDAAK